MSIGTNFLMYMKTSLNDLLPIAEPKYLLPVEVISITMPSKVDSGFHAMLLDHKKRFQWINVVAKAGT